MLYFTCCGTVADVAVIRFFLPSFIHMSYVVCFDISDSELHITASFSFLNTFCSSPLPSSTWTGGLCHSFPMDQSSEEFKVLKTSPPENRGSYSIWPICLPTSFPLSPWQRKLNKMPFYLTHILFSIITHRWDRPSLTIVWGADSKSFLLKTITWLKCHLWGACPSPYEWLCSLNHQPSFLGLSGVPGLTEQM